MIDLSAFDAHYIPLIRNDKKPSTKFKGKTFDSDYLNDHFHKHGNFGLLAQPDFIFIDIDVSHGDDGMANFINWLKENDLDPKQIIDKTLTAQTATGGFHLVYLQDKKNHFKQDIGFLDGVDIKASPNNYIVVEPSVINGKRYQWVNKVDPLPIPPKLAQALRDTAEEARRQKRLEIETNGGDAIVDGLRYTQAFTKYPVLDVFYTIEHGWGEQGKRNVNIFKWAQAMRKQTDQETTMRWAELANNNSDEPLDIDEVDRTVDSAFGFKQELATVVENGITFVELTPIGVTKYAVTIESYEKRKSLNATDYSDDELLTTGIMDKFNKSDNSIYAYAQAHRDQAKGIK